MATTTVTDSSFQDEVLGADKPVLVDFWANWCMPCKRIAPALEEISKEIGDRVTIAKLDIDENPEAPQRYHVRGIPTMILFKDGELVSSLSGGHHTKSQLQAWIEGELQKRDAAAQAG